LEVKQAILIIKIGIIEKFNSVSCIYKHPRSILDLCSICGSGLILITETV